LPTNHKLQNNSELIVSVANVTKSLREAKRCNMTIAERKQREKAQRREDILNAAEKLFFSRGYDSVSMDEIAADVELNKATLYLYFKDKESLYFAVVNRGIKILRAMIMEEAKNVQTGDIKFGELSMASFKFIQEYPDYARACIYFRSGRFDLSNPETLSSDAQEIIEFAEELFEKILLGIQFYIEEGTFRPDVNPAVVVVISTFITDGLANISPFLRKFMETHGITMQQLNLEIGDLVYRMVMNTGEKSENMYSRMSKWRNDRIATDQSKD
jgi:TetR/AcrR family transcriptional regulator